MRPLRRPPGPEARPFAPPGPPLTPELIEQVRFPGEAEAARALRRTKGFREALRRARLDDQLRPPRDHLEGLLLEGEALPRWARGTVDAVARWLGVRQPVDLYQLAPPMSLAWTQVGGRVQLMMHGPLLERLGPQELATVVGSALGRLVAHGAGERGDLARVAGAWCDRFPMRDDEPRRLRAAAMDVAQRVTADRLALLAAGDLETFLRANLKTRVSFEEGALRFDLVSYLAQVREALELGHDSWGRGDGATSPVLARAAELFASTRLFRGLIGRRGGRPLDEVNEEVASLLTGWTPRRAESIDPLTFERFLLAAGTAVATADGRFSSEEKAFLARALPRAWTGRPLPRPEAEATLEQVAALIRERGDARARSSTLSFLCLLVDADGRATPQELAAIDLLGGALGARELFRQELSRRHFFDPAAHRLPGDGGDGAQALPPLPGGLVRFLATVRWARRRCTSARSLLRLAGAERRSPRALSLLGRALAEARVAVAADLTSVDLDEPFWLRARPARR